MSSNTQIQRTILPAVHVLQERKQRTADLLKKPRMSETVISVILFLCGFLSILTTVGIVVVLGSEALRFFSTVEWANTNKETVAGIDAEATTLTVTTSGAPLREGDVIRIGTFGAEQLEVVSIIDAATIEVKRGVRGTQPEATATNVIFSANEVTLGKFLTGSNWAPQIGRFGVRPLVNSTLMTSAIAMLVAIPLGLGAAIYMSEYASWRTRNTLKPILEILAGVPTVVYGYFALTFVTPILRDLLGTDTVKIYNMASAGIVVGFLIVPTIATISEDALNAVPRALREASFGLGATKLETVSKVLLPAALSGVIASFILAMSRAIGETMIVLLAAGAGPNLTMNPFDSAETMAGHIARISTGDLSFGSIDYNSLFAIGLTLFVLTLILNLISTLIVRRFREVYA